MAKKHTLFHHEKPRLAFLCCKFGELFPVYFPRVASRRKIRKLFCNVPPFVEEHGTVSLFSEDGESLHHEINLESAQLSSVRCDPERLWLVVERHEHCSQAECSLLTPPPR